MTHVFDPLIGNDTIKQYLTRMVERDTVPQSLLFSGPEGIGKGLFAQAFAKLILKTDRSQHSDIRIYRPEGKIGMHSMESLRKLSEEVYLAPFEGEKKVFIIHDAHRMLPTSANALLKTFEEPALHSIIILISSSPERLLPTVLSRCQSVRFQAVSYDELAPFVQERKGVSLEEAEKMALRARGSIARALEGQEQEGSSLRDFTLKMIAQGGIQSYSSIIQYAKQLAELIDEQLKESEQALRAHLLEEYGDQVTAVQKQGIEKEVEGFVSMQKQAKARTFFDSLLGWYRDLQLLYSKGDNRLLLNPDYSDQLRGALQRGEIFSLEKIQAAVSDAILSLERSTPLNLCFENLLIRIGTTLA